MASPYILGPGCLLRCAIQADQLASLIFYGPPGTGKTTLARVIANTTRSHFASINAMLAGVKEIREATAEADSRRKHHGRRTILFVDEVHRSLPPESKPITSRLVSIPGCKSFLHEL